MDNVSNLSPMSGIEKDIDEETGGWIETQF